MKRFSLIAAALLLMGAGPLPQTIGPQKVLIYTVTYANGLSSVGLDVAITRAAEIAEYFRQQSYGLTTLVGDKNPTGPDVIAVKIALTSCQPANVHIQAQQAAATLGYNIAAYRGFLAFMPPNGCAFGRGTSTQGPIPFRSSCWEISIAACAHEVGHGFGLWHARREDCPNCGAAGEYSDHSDLMANSAGVLGAFQRWRLGWLDRAGTPPLVVTTQPGTWTISALDAMADGKPKAVKILRSGTNYWYITYRNCQQYNNGYCGVYVHSGSDGVDEQAGFFLAGDTSLAHTWIDFGSDWTLDVGQLFSDYPNGRFFSVASKTANEAAIRITSVPPALGDEWTLCTLQNGTCQPPSNTTQIAFGANNGFVYRAGNQSVTCNQDAFAQGDPVPNVPKACYYKASGLPPPPIPVPLGLSAQMPATINYQGKDIPVVWK